MKALRKAMAVLLAIMIVFSVTLTAAVGVLADGEETVQDGVRVVYSSAVTANASDIYLNSLCSSLNFKDGGVDCLSLSFTNEGANTLSVTFKDMGKFEETKSVAAGATVLFEQWNKTVANTDTVYFYVSGISGGASVKFSVNYVENVNYASKVTVGGVDQSLYSVQTVSAPKATLTLNAQTGVAYTVAVPGSSFAYPRGAASYSGTYPVGKSLSVYSTVDKLYQLVNNGLKVNGTLLPDSKSCGTFTLNEDTVAQTDIDTASVKKNGYTFAFKSGLTATSTNVYMNKMSLADMAFGDGTKLSATVYNDGTTDIGAILRVIPPSWGDPVATTGTTTVPAQSHVTLEIENASLAASGNFAYMWFKDITPTSKLRVVFNNTANELTYPALASGDFDGGVFNYCDAYTQYEKAYTFTLDEAQYNLYDVTVNGSAKAKQYGVKSFAGTFLKGTEIKVDSFVTDQKFASAFEGFVLNGETVTDALTYTFDIAENTVLKMNVAVDGKAYDGLTLTFNNNLTATAGNFWLNNVYSIDKLTYNNGTQLSFTIYNEGGSETGVIAVAAKGSGGDAAERVNKTIAAGDCATFEMTADGLSASGNYVYVYLTKLNTASKLRIVVNNVDNVDYFAATSAKLQGTGENTFSVSTKLVDVYDLDVRDCVGAKYNVTVAGSTALGATNAESFTASLLAGTPVKVDVIKDGVWDSTYEGLSVNGEKEDAVTKSFTMQADTDIIASYDAEGKMLNGLTLDFSATPASGDFWFNAASIESLMNGDDISFTVYNEGADDVTVIGTTLNTGDWSNRNSTGAKTVPAGASKTMFINDIVRKDSKDCFYLNIDAASADTKLRIVFNNSDTDYTLFTDASLNDGSKDAFDAYTVPTDTVAITLGAQDNVKYTLKVNETALDGASHVAGGTYYVLPGSSIGVTADVEGGYDAVIWTKNGINQGNGDTYSFVAENDATVAAMIMSVAESKVTSAQVVLGTDITVQLGAVVKGTHSNVKLKVTLDGMVSNLSGISQDGTYYVFNYENVSPQYLAEEFTAELILDGETVSTVKYSVLQYCNSVLKMNVPETTKQLIRDLLVYGGAAQNYMGYNTSNLASAGIVGRTYTNIASTDLKLQSNNAVAGYGFKAANVVFRNYNKLYFRLVAADCSKATVKLYKNGALIGEYNCTDLEDADGKEGKLIYTDAIYATHFDDLYKAELYVDGTLCQTLTYSVKSYVYSKQASSDAMAELAKAVYNYGISAKEFVAVS